MSKIATCILGLLCCFAAFGGTATDSVIVYFDLNQSVISPSVGDNALLMESFVKRVAALDHSGDLLNISVSGFASPEGPLRLNERLATERSQAIAARIIQQAAISPDIVSVKSGGVAWADLRSLIQESDEYGDYRAQILQILDDTALSSDVRLGRLKQIGQGKPYRRMLKEWFPSLRYAKAVAYFREQLADTCATQASEEHSPAAQLPAIPDASYATETVPQTPENGGIPAPRHLLALKTNLLYYAALMPNLSVEWLVNKQWSVAVEGNMAWWSNEPKLKCYRIATVDVEGRYWVRPRDFWHGFYVGAFAGGGLYDLENGKNGHQGEGAFAGASVGYMWPVRRNISLEVGLGAGYLYTRDKEYMPYEGHYVYQRSRSINYFGPLKLKFSFVWRFLDRDKAKRKGGRK